MENFAKLNRNDIQNKKSEKNEKNYANNDYISKEDTQNEINLIKGTESNIKVESSSTKGKNLINLENPNENIFIEAQNNSSRKSMESTKINNKNESETENIRKEINEYEIPLKIKDDETKIKDSEIKKKDIIINELNQYKTKDKEITHNNNYRQSERKKPLDFYENPTLIGLQNIGADSYMNAILQCFSQIEELTNYFLDENISGDKIRNNNIAMKNENLPQLSPVYLELLKKLWDKNNIKGTYSPYKFKEILETMSPLFKFDQPRDSKDFINFLLYQFRDELRKDVSNNNYYENNNYEINIYNQQNSFMFFLKEFKESSIISDIFIGIQENTFKCLFCKEKFSRKGKPFPIIYNYQIFHFLVFPLEEIRKIKNENNKRSNMNMINNNEVTLEDCFYFNEMTDLFTGDNRIYCNICKQFCDCLYTSKIYSCPKVLIIILNRGINNIYKVKLNFEEIIDITKFVSVKERNVIYKLIGVITHLSGDNGGNFIAFCRSPIDNNWYRYNDSIVTKVENVKKDIIDFETPNILFYTKVKSNQNKS